MPVSLFASYTGEDALSGINLELYTQLKAAIENIADGKVSSTVITAEVSCTTTSLGVAPITSDGTMAAAADAFAEALDYNLVLSYLIYDCPYELFWFDKASVIYTEQEFSGKNTTLTVGITISLPVTADYQANGSSTTVDSAKVSLARTAAEYAQSIVKKYASYSDEEKLAAFRDAICSLVSYEKNYLSYDYGDIWQIVYVFDQDSSTNVVCEGYSKAFKYLCDLAGIDCITVTGTMTGGTGAGEHMWNVVRLDGVNYLVDLTNSDSGSVGQNGGLFMVCASDASSSSSSGYSFTVGSKTISYEYDSLTLSLYPSRYLTLGTSNKTTGETAGETSEETTEEVHTHTLTKTKAKDATCTADGNIDYWYCSGCDTYFSDKNATTEITLSDTVVAATGHNYVSTVTDPTCTEGGYTTHTCSNCGDSYVDSETDALGHDYESEVTTEATCTEAGVRTYTCRRCGDSYTEEIESTGHDYEETVTDPTCTEGGYTTYTCSICGDSYTDSETDALGHNYESEVTTEATWFSSGVRIYTCTVCGDSYTEETEALGYDFKENVFTFIVSALSFVATQGLAVPVQLLFREALAAGLEVLFEMVI